MKRYTSLWKLHLILAAVALNGCCSIPDKEEAVAVEVAKQEMRRRGWERIEVDRCLLQNGVWIVDVSSREFRGAHFATVRVSSDGTVLNVFENLK